MANYCKRAKSFRICRYTHADVAIKRTKHDMNAVGQCQERIIIIILKVTSLIQGYALCVVMLLVRLFGT